MSQPRRANHLLKNVAPQTWRTLTEYAASHGIYEHPRADGLGTTHRDSAKPKRGSVRGLLEHIASGDALFVLLADDLEYDLAPRLREIARSEAGMTADLLNRIAAALDDAKVRFDAAD